ncbi:MAG: MarR family transcriptional regulator [Bacteroidales bacterium]|nr:MarR family transcriptional regulator [Bacteroidales bacterium]
MAYQQLNLDLQLGFRLYTVSRFVVQCYKPFLDKVGLTYLQYMTMMVLWEKDNILVGDITKRLMLDTNTVTPLLQRMEKEGLITREKSKQDTRQRIVSLTEKGKELEEQAKDVPLCMSQFLYDNNISQEELIAMVPTLDHMIQNLKHKTH